MLNKHQIDKDQSNQDIKLHHTATSFQDSISAISWIPSLNSNHPQNIFAVTTWGGTFRIYQIIQSQNGPQIHQKNLININTPILSCCWNGQNNGVIIGCGDKTLKTIDIATRTITVIGKHQNAVKDVFYVPNQNTIISTSYDKIINFWQIGNQNPVARIQTNNKIYTSDFKYPLFTAALSDEKLLLFDITNLNLKTYLESPLGKSSQIQSLEINNDKDVVGIGSIDGRANLSTVNKNQNGEFKMTNIMSFKSNKIQQNGKSIMYPVNSISFNPRHKKWFMTGGADGNMQYWDYQSKNKIKQYSYNRTPVTAARVNSSGQFLAYGLGNDWHMGPQGIGKWNVKLCVHHIKEEQMKYQK